MYLPKNPKIKDLLRALKDLNPEAYVFVSDKNEGINQVELTVGFVTVAEVHDYCYVQEEPDDEHNVPAIRIDTGC